MTASLSWRNAARSDRSIIEAFRCCSPPQDGGTAPEWEALVDRLIHRQKPPGGPNRGYLLGFVGEVLAVVVIVDDLREGTEFFHIAIVGVSHIHRRTGEHFGDQAIDRAVEWVAERARATNLTEAIVTANIHLRNEASAKCFRRAGFTRDPDAPNGDYQQWIIVLDL